MANPAPAPAHFPYRHRPLSIADVPTMDPAVWRAAHRPFFDAMYGPDDIPNAIGGKNPLIGQRRAGLAAARRWRAENKPRFDALYGPDEWAEYNGRVSRP